jgi:hypothetical protein
MDGRDRGHPSAAHEDGELSCHDGQTVALPPAGVNRDAVNGAGNAAGGYAGTCRSGIGRAVNSRRHGLAIMRAQRLARLTRALSVAMPVFAYIWR